MRKFQPYLFKKVYLDEKVFEDDADEIIVGYININGLKEGNHAQYLNADYNLMHLDILVLSETKLNHTDTANSIMKDLDKWIVLERYDAGDGKKHMGLLVLSSMESSRSSKILGFTHQVVNRNDKLQIQGLKVELRSGLTLGFVFCRSTPNKAEIKAMNEYF